jgi:hypothetical protein
MCDPTTSTAACGLGLSLLSFVSFGFLTLVSFASLLVLSSNQLALLIHNRREE